MQAAFATIEDVASWLELAQEVEPLFGPMPAFQATLLRKIGEGSAFCVRSDASSGQVRVMGGMLTGCAPPHGWIRWLAVRSSDRGQGVGRCLVRRAIEHFSLYVTVSVHTFPEDNIEGRPARLLYQRMGFQPGPLIRVDDQFRQCYTIRKTNESQV